MTSSHKSIIYTRTGDSGTTSLVGGTRIDKDNIRLEAYGTIDELNSHVGLLAAEVEYAEVLTNLRSIQNLLFDIGAYLATPADSPYRNEYPVSQATIRALEKIIDTLDSQVPPAHNFVLPGGTHASAQAQVARTVCRRAERRIVTLAREVEVSQSVTIFINRLSDYLFVLARWLNYCGECDEIMWTKDCTL